MVQGFVSKTTVLETPPPFFRSRHKQGVSKAVSKACLISPSGLTGFETVLPEVLFRSETAVLAGKVLGAMTHQEGGEFAIHVLTRPGIRDLNDAGVELCTDERSEVIAIASDDNASLSNRKLIHRWIIYPTMIEVIPDMLYVKVFVEPGKQLTR
jgi:hypothetical protein